MSLKNPRFRAFATSLPGPKYQDKGLECQDSTGLLVDQCEQIIAVADGHGGSTYFRSEYGSWAAVQAAVVQAQKFTEGACQERGESIEFSDSGIMNLKYSILEYWRDTVRVDWERRLEQVAKLGDGEVRYLEVKEKYQERFTSPDESVVARYLYTAYGTTLLVAIAIKSKILLIQIGDGTCVVLKRDGEYQVPVPSDPDIFFNITTSMSEESSHLKMRHAIIECTKDTAEQAVAVFLSSDGLDDCYPIFENECFLSKLYTLILENILQVGFEATEKEITEDLLPQKTNKGSQDDISLAYLIENDLDILREAYNNINQKYKAETTVNETQVED